MKEIYKHILWVGCIMCVAPLVVRGYMWGKCTDALANGSNAKFTLPAFHRLEHTVVFLGAIIIATVIIRALCTPSSGKYSNGSRSHESLNADSQA